MTYDRCLEAQMTKTILCQCWNCGKQVRVPDSYPLPAEHEIFCAKCRRDCGIQPAPKK